MDAPLNDTLCTLCVGDNLAVCAYYTRFFLAACDIHLFRSTGAGVRRSGAQRMTMVLVVPTFFRSSVPQLVPFRLKEK